MFKILKILIEIGLKKSCLRKLNKVFGPFILSFFCFLSFCWTFNNRLGLQVAIPPLQWNVSSAFLATLKMWLPVKDRCGLLAPDFSLWDGWSWQAVPGWSAPSPWSLSSDSVFQKQFPPLTWSRRQICNFHNANNACLQNLTSFQTQQTWRWIASACMALILVLARLESCLEGWGVLGCDQKSSLGGEWPFTLSFCNEVWPLLLLSCSLRFFVFFFLVWRMGAVDSWLPICLRRITFEDRGGYGGTVIKGYG